MLKCEIIGNLGASAETRTVNGQSFVSFRVAHSVTQTDTQTGQVSEATTWVSCTMNGDGGRVLQFLRKGTKVFLRGNLSVRLYVGNDGQKHAGLNLYVAELELLSSRTRLEDVTRFIDEVPEARQNVYDYLVRYADQSKDTEVSAS